MKAGFYEIDITPLLGMSCTSFDEAAPKAILTPLSIMASAWSDGTQLVAVVGIDIVMIAEDIINAALTELKRKTDLALLLCGASHAHKGGPARKFYAGNEEVFRNIEELSPEIRQLGMEANLYFCSEVKRGNKRLNQQYRDSLKNKIVEAVSGAITRMEEVKLINGRANVEDVGYNRRQKMRNGYTVTHAGKNNPDIIDFAGPVDKEVVVLAAVNKQNKVIGTIVNYACHGTVENGDGFSADWPYFMRETVKKMLGQETVTVFLNGCCGDVTQINNLNTEPIRAGGKWPKILGQRVGFAAVDAISIGQLDKFEKIAFVSENLPLTYRKPGKKNYESAIASANIPPDDSYARWWGMGTLILNTQRKLNPEINCELNALQIGNLLICTIPAETFAQTGLDIKTASPLPYTMVSGLTNGGLGYMPTADAFGSSGGGYESKFKFGSYLEKTADKKVKQKLVEIISTMRAEKEIIQESLPASKPWQAWQPDEL